jgi:fatty acid desaturase
MKYVIINNQCYDISEFMDKHPGGKYLLEMSLGYDVTENFNTHHLSKNAEIFLQNSKHIKKIHKSQLELNNSGNKNFFSQDYHNLKKIVNEKSTSFDDRNLAYRVLWVLFIYMLLYLLNMHFMNTTTILLLGIWTFVTLTNTFHCQTHNDNVKYSFTKYFMDILGASTDVWKYSHNILHHQYTNQINDPDIHHPYPLIRYCASQPKYFYHKFQLLYAPFLYSFTSIAFVFHSILFTFFPNFFKKNLNQHMHLGYVSKKKFIFLKFLSFLLYIYLPQYYGHSFSHVIKNLVFTHMVCGIQVGLILDSSHINVNSDFNHAENDWMKRQINNTTNFGCNSLLTHIYTGGLNLQIQHHLFPHIDQMNLLAIKDDVKVFLEKNGYKYNSCNLFQAIYNHLYHLYTLS